jgi:putative component of membrane protein insertase Oxa1/YidC/SpoIIIJ protein YidD
MSPAATAVDRAIRAYQRHLSPRKDWRCAYGVLTGDTTCSAAVRGLLARRGLVRGLVPSVLQILACYRAAQALRLTQEVRGVCCCGPIPIPFRFGSDRRG